MRPLRKVIMQELEYYQIYSPLREATQSICYMWVELIRRAVLEAGRRSEAGELLFYLGLDDVGRVLRGEQTRGLLERARALRRRLRLARAVYVPHTLRSDDLQAIGGTPEVAKGAQELTGDVASSGIAQGRARVVTDLDEADDLAPGEILVTVTAEPSWTPLFLVAEGLVLEQGGMLSHGAILCNCLGAYHLFNDCGELNLDNDQARESSRVEVDLKRGPILAPKLELVARLGDVLPERHGPHDRIVGHVALLDNADTVLGQTRTLAQRRSAGSSV